MSPSKLASRSLIKALWRPPKLSGGWVVELYDFDGCGPAILSDDPTEDGWRVRAIKHKPNEYGLNKRVEHASVFIPYRRQMEHWLSGQLADYFAHYLGLLALMLSPPPKPPKGWRLYGRRPHVWA